MKLLQSADVFSHAEAQRRKEGREGVIGVGYNFGRSKLVQFVSCLMSSMPTTEELLEQLNVLIKGLDSRKVGFPTRGGGNLLKTFCWKKSEKGICNLINLLIDSKFIKQSTLEDYIRDLEDEFVYSLGQPKMSEKINTLINLLETELDDFEAYEVYGDDGTSFKIGVGLTENNQWLGISPLLNNPRDKCSFGKDLVRIFEKLDRDDFELKQKIKNILGDLQLPIKLEYWRIEIESIGNIVELSQNKETIVELILQKANAVKVFYFHYFFAIHIVENGDEEEYIDLNIFMQKHLKNIKLYEIGISGSIYLYVIGETPEGDWLGISTSTSYSND